MPRQASGSGSPPDRAVTAPAVLLFFLMAVFVCFPFLQSPTTLLPGDEVLSEVYLQPWSIWWVHESLIRDGRLPFHTDMLYYPEGGNFFSQMSFNALLVLPLRVFSHDPTLLFNCAIFLNLFLGGIFTLLFLHGLVKDRTAALLGTVVYMTCPLLISFFRTGYSQGTNMIWLPLALHLFLRMVERPGIARAVAAALGFAGLCFANFYAGVAALLFLLFYLAWHAPGLVRRREKTALQTMALFIVFTGILCVGLFLLVGSTFQQSPLLRLNRAISSDVLLRFSNPDAAKFLIPAGKYEFSRLVECYYLGLTVLSFILLPLSRRLLAGQRDASGSPRRRFFAFLLLFMLVIALGPFLLVDGTFAELWGGPVRLPLYYPFTYAPSFEVLRHPDRLMSLAYLAMAALVAMNFKELDVKGLKRVLAAVIIGAAFTCEYLFVAPVIFPVPVVSASCPDYCRFIAEQPGDFAILSLPFTGEFSQEDIYKYYQTFHRKRLGNGFIDPVATSLKSLSLVQFLRQYEREGRGQEDVNIDAFRRDGKKLAKVNFRYITVDMSMMRRWDRLTIPTLNAVFGKPLRFKDGLVYTVR